MFGEHGALLHLVGRPVDTNVDDPRNAAEWVVETQGVAYALDLAETIQGIVATPLPPVPPPGPGAQGTIGARILAVLRGAPDGMENAEIAKAVGKDRKRSHQALLPLVQQGKVRKDGLRYHLVT